MGFSLIWWLDRELGPLTVRNVCVLGKSRLGLFQGGFSQTHLMEIPRTKILKTSLLGEWMDLGD